MGLMGNNELGRFRNAKIMKVHIILKKISDKKFITL